jgi:hypothetical protein
MLSPSLLNSVRMYSTLVPLSEFNAPVGSSANITDGEFIAALTIPAL